MTPQMPKVPKPPAPAKMPQSPIDVAQNTRPDATTSAFSSLISSSPMGVKKAALGAKKSLLGGAK